MNKKQKTHHSQVLRLRRALKVIHTWSTFRGGVALIPEHVAELCAKALAETASIDDEPHKLEIAKV